VKDAEAEWRDTVLMVQFALLAVAVLTIIALMIALLRIKGCSSCTRGRWQLHKRYAVLGMLLFPYSLRSTIAFRLYGWCCVIWIFAGSWYN